MTCPLLRFFALFLPAPLPRPRFLPALLTLVTLFQMCSAVSKKKKLLTNYKLIKEIDFFEFNVKIDI